MHSGIPQRLALFSTLLLVSSLTAADTARITPVPATEPIPISDFFRPPYMRGPVINPGGSQVAALVSSGEDRQSLMVLDLVSNKPELLKGTDESDLNSVDWLNDRRLVFGFRRYHTYPSGMYAGEVGHLTEFYPLLQYVSPTLLAVPPSSRTRPLVALPANTMNTGQEGNAVVINTDLRTGRVVNMSSVLEASLDPKDAQEDNQNHIEKTVVGPKQGRDAGFLADIDGKLAFGFTGDKGVFSMFRWTGSDWEKTAVNLDEVDILGHGRTHDEVLVRGPRKEGQPRPLQFLNAVTGELSESLLEDKAYDFFGALFYDPATRALLGARFERNGPAAGWFSEPYVKLQKVLDGYFPGLIVRLIGSDEAGRMLLVETYSDRQPAAYYWINLEKKAFGLIAKSMPWIDPERMGRTSIVSYKTHDGQKLDAYVTMPAGASKQHTVPMVVLPPSVPGIFQGGYYRPTERATWGFNARAQYFVSRGYAVLQPNHRGSAGYGWKFPAGDQWELGKMADDIATATRYILATGLIDAKRIGIMGRDVAAYLAVAAAEADPELYRAVVAVHGTYDWAKYLRTQREFQYSGNNYGVLARHLGDEKKLAELSVESRLNKLRAAVLVCYQREQGEATQQSTNFAGDLNRANVRNETLGLGGERSNLDLVRNQEELYTRTEAFLAKNLSSTP